MDVITEMLANVNLQRDLQMLNVHGRVAVIGSRGDVEISPRLTMAKESSVLGIMLWQTSLVSQQQRVVSYLKLSLIKNI